MTGVFFSVIIPTCNRNDLLGKCLQRLSPGMQSLGSDYYEVIVSDDSKTNLAKSFIEENYKWVKWVEGPKRGPAANRNNGANYSNSNWLVFTDDDCQPDVNWLNFYYGAISSFPACQAFEGAILPDDWNLLKKDMAECPVNTEGGVFWSANIMIRRELFMKIGGFDHKFKIAAQEDQDIYLRLRKHTEVIFLKSCIVTHPVRVISLRKKISQISVALENWFYLRKKYEHSFFNTLANGFRSQYLALFLSLRKSTFRKATYHFVILLYFFPSIFWMQLFRNEK
jgi:GT2 family glycosyltransferase